MTKIRTVLVHIGIEKTGTSTLQEFLHQNREKLAQHGVGFLKSPGLRNNRKLVNYCMAEGRSDNYFNQLGLTTIESVKTWKKKFKKELADEIVTLSSDIKDIIISSEHFHSRLYFIEEIETLRNLLEPYFEEVKIIVYLRRQDKTAVSLFSTACRVGFPMKDILPQNPTEDSYYYNYFNLLEKWSDVFGRQSVIPRIFEADKLDQGDLITDFISNSHIIDRNWDLVRPVNQNESLSATSQDVMLCFNKYFQSNGNQKFIDASNLLRKILLQKLEAMFQGKSKLPSRQDAMKFYRVFSESNKKLAIDWFNSDKLFSEDFSDYPEENHVALKELDIVNCLFSTFSEFIRKWTSPMKR